jgi:H-type lectin domain
MKNSIFREVSESIRWSLLKVLVAVICAALGIERSAEAQIPQLIHYEGRIAVNNTNFDGAGQFKFAFVDGGANPSVTATATATVVSGFVVSIQLISGGSGYVSPPAVTITDPFGTGATASATVSGGAVTTINVTNAGFGYSPFPTVTVASPVVYTTYWSNDGTSVGGSQPGSFVSLPVSKGLYSLNLGDTALPNMMPLPASIFTHSDVRLRIWFNDGVRGFQQLSPDQRVAAVGYALMADNVKDGAITSAKIAAGAVGSAQIAAGGIQGANIAAGSIGSAQIAFGGIQMNNIASGAIGSAQIAPGVVGFGNLAKPPQSGTIDGSGLSMFSGNGPFSVNFPLPYASPPVVTVSVQGVQLPASSLAGISVDLTSITTAGFAGHISNFQSPSVTIDSPLSVGQYNSLKIVNGTPAVSYYKASAPAEIKFVRALDAYGNNWGTPVTVGAGSTATSLAVVAGAPAIAYSFQAGPAQIRFVRASDSDGAIWETPVTVAYVTNQPGNRISTALTVVEGRPAIAYNAGYFNNSGAASLAGLNFVQATDTIGSNWNAPVSVDTGSVGQNVSVAIINGNPAMSYYDNNISAGDLKYARSVNANGSAWNPPVIVDSAGTVGDFSSLAVVDGRPAITYYDSTNTSLKYARALDVDGVTWGAPITIDSRGNVGQYSSLVVVSGRPCVAYSDATNGNLKFLRALDSDGATWMEPNTLISNDSVGTFTSMITVLGDPAISFFDATESDLRFLRLPAAAPLKVNWIALPP